MAGRKSTEPLTIAGQADTATTDDDLAGKVSADVYPDGTQVDRPKHRSRNRFVGGTNRPSTTLVIRPEAAE